MQLNVQVDSLCSARYFLPASVEKTHVRLNGAMDPTTLGGSGTAVKCGVGRPWHWPTHCNTNHSVNHWGIYSGIYRVIYTIQGKPLGNIQCVSTANTSNCNCNWLLCPVFALCYHAMRYTILCIVYTQCKSIWWQDSNIQWASASKVQVFIRSSQCFLLQAGTALPNVKCRLVQLLQLGWYGQLNWHNITQCSTI